MGMMPWWSPAKQPSMVSGRPDQRGVVVRDRPMYIAGTAVA